MSLLLRKLTLFSDAKATIPKAYPTVEASLAAIRAPGAKIVETIARIRAEPEKEARRALKSTLPALVWGAECAGRAVRNPTGLMCLDLDHLPDPAKIKSALATDRHVIAAFFSPSGDGIKIVVPVLGDYKGAFASAKDWFEKAYQVEVDTSRSDINGLCFASHDPDLYVAADPDVCEPFKPHAKDEASEGRYAQEAGDVLMDYLSSRAASDPLMTISPNCSYSQWIEIGQALHCQFGGTGEGFELWDRWSSHGGSYPGTQELNKHWRSFRGSGRTFRTVLHYANQAGWSRPGRPRKSVTVGKIVPASDELGDLITAQAEGLYQVVPFPFPMLTEASRSLLPGSVTLLCGAPGSAKSWFILSCLRYWSERSIPAAVLMLEESKAWHMNRLLAQLVGDARILNPEWVRANADQVHYWHKLHRAAIDRVGSQLHCDGNVTASACCEWVEQQAANGARIIVVDPITLADPGNQKPWDADRQLMARCKVAIDRHGASLLLVTHPRKSPGVNKAGPNMDDMAGGASYNRAAASVLWLAGYETPTSCTVRTDKNIITHGVAHKQMRVMKARNSTGQHSVIAFTFRDLAFEELGCITKDAPVDQVDSEDSPSTRARKLDAKPSDAEERF